MVKVISRKIYFCAVILFFICAIYSLVGRYVVTQVPSYKPFLEQWLSNQLNAPVQIDRLEAGWEILNPVVYAKNVHLKNPVVEAPHLKNIKLQVNLLSSLWHRSLQLRGMEIQGVDLTVEKTAENQLHLVGIPVSAKPFELSQWIDLVLSQQHIALSQVAIHYRTAQQQKYDFTTAQMILGKSGSDYQISAPIRLKQAKKTLEFLWIAQGQRDSKSRWGWRGDFYLKLKPTELSDWLSADVWLSIPIKKVNLNAEIWGGIDSSTATWLQGQIKANNILIQYDHIQKFIPHLATRVQWQQKDLTDWQLLLDELNLQYSQHNLHNEKVWITQQKREQGSSNIQLQMSRWPLVWLQDVADFLPNQNIKKTLQAMKWLGNLKDFDGHLVLDKNNQFAIEHINTNFSDISCLAYHDIPGFNHLNGFVSGNLQQGVIDIHSDVFGLDLTPMFRWPMTGQQLSTQLHWYKDKKNNLQIESGLLKVLAGSAQARGFLSLTFPEKSAPIFRLNATAWNGDGRETAKYLPVQTMDASLVNWLDTAVLSGHLIEGQFLFNGSLDQKASLENKQHTFQMRYQVDQANLDYQPPWPALHQVTADALILGREASIQLIHGNLLKGSQAKGWVTIPYFGSKDTPHLKVNAQVDSMAEDGVEVLKTSPIHQVLSDSIDTLTGKGPTFVDLNLDIPLSEVQSKKQKIQVSVDLKNIELGLAELGLSAKQLQGKILYDQETGLSSPLLTGVLLDQTVKAQIKTSINSGRSNTQVNFQGIADTFSLSRWQSHPVWTFAKGQTPYTAQLNIQPAYKKQAAKIDLAIHSPLTGVAIQLPAPLKKSVDTQRNLNYQWQRVGNMQTIRVQVDQLLKAWLLKDNNKIRGQIALGHAPINRSLKPGIFVQGDFEKLDLEPWYAWSHQTQAVASAVQSGDMLKNFNGLKIHAQQLQWGHYTLPDASLSLITQPYHQWILKNDNINLYAQIPNDVTSTNSIQLDFKMLNLPESLLQDLTQNNLNQKKVAKSEFPSINPSRWLPMMIDIEHLKIGDQGLGHWHFKVQPRSESLAINNLTAEFKSLNLQGQGLWNLSDKTTRFDGVAQTQDVAALMQAWGYAPSATSDQANTSVHLSWPGAPWDANLKNMMGQFDVKLQKGKLLNVEGASSIKAVSALNLQNLQKFLKLDFSNLKKGVDYDQMQGHFNLNQGILSTPQFSMAGPSMQLNLSGKAYLDKKTLDQQLDVTVPVGRNLVVPAAVVGGLPVAATLYVIDKTLGNQLNKLSTFHFKLEGDWDKPKVTQHFFKENP